MRHRRSYPANIPTRYWLTPSGVRTPTSENTNDMRSGLTEIVSEVDQELPDNLTECNPHRDFSQSARGSWCAERRQRRQLESRPLPEQS